LRDHRGVVVAAAPEIPDELVGRERIGVDRLQLAVLGDRGRLARFVPLAELLAPELAGEDLPAGQAATAAAAFAPIMNGSTKKNW
jgi:hypothetical protein